MAVQNNSILIAKKAKDALLKIKGKEEYLPPEFIHFLNGFPSFISQNGLLQAVSFVKTKYRDLYKTLDEFLKDDKSNDLIDTLLSSGNMTTYIVYQKRAISFSIWLKRLANALFKEDKNDGK